MVLRTARIAIACTLGLSGCLTVAPPGFVRSGQRAFYRGWCDVNTLNAPALYFERVKEFPYPEERVQAYPRVHAQAPGPRLALEGPFHMIAPAGAVPPPGPPAGDAGEPLLRLFGQ